MSILSADDLVETGASLRGIAPLEIADDVAQRGERLGGFRVSSQQGERAPGSRLESEDAAEGEPRPSAPVFIGVGQQSMPRVDAQGGGLRAAV